MTMLGNMRLPWVGRSGNVNDIPTMFNQQGADIAINAPRTPEEIQRANLAAQGGMSDEEAMELFMSFDPEAAEAFAQEQEYRALQALKPPVFTNDIMLGTQQPPAPMMMGAAGSADQYDVGFNTVPVPSVAPVPMAGAIGGQYDMGTNVDPVINITPGGWDPTMYGEGEYTTDPFSAGALSSTTPLAPLPQQRDFGSAADIAADESFADLMQGQYGIDPMRAMVQTIGANQPNVVPAPIDTTQDIVDYTDTRGPVITSAQAAKVAQAAQDRRDATPKRRVTTTDDVDTTQDIVDYTTTRGPVVTQDLIDSYLGDTETDDEVVTAGAAGAAGAAGTAGTTGAAGAVVPAPTVAGPQVAGQAASGTPLWQQALDPFQTYRRWRMGAYPGLSLTELGMAEDALGYGYNPAMGRFLLRSIADTPQVAMAAGAAPGTMIDAAGLPMTPDVGGVAAPLDAASLDMAAAQPIGEGGAFREYLTGQQRRPLSDIRATYGGLGDWLRARAAVGSGALDADLAAIDPRYEAILGGEDPNKLASNIIQMSQAALGMRPGMESRMSRGLANMYNRMQTLYGPEGGARFADWVTSAYGGSPAYQPFGARTFQPGTAATIAGTAGTAGATGTLSPPVGTTREAIESFKPAMTQQAATAALAAQPPQFKYRPGASLLKSASQLAGAVKPTEREKLGVNYLDVPMIGPNLPNQAQTAYMTGLNIPEEQPIMLPPDYGVNTGSGNVFGIPKVNLSEVGEAISNINLPSFRLW